MEWVDITDLNSVDLLVVRVRFPFSVLILNNKNMNDINDKNAIDIAATIFFNIYKDDFKTQKQIYNASIEAKNGNSKQLKLYLKELSDICNKISDLI